jgi:hypothetical protein
MKCKIYTQPSAFLPSQVPLVLESKKSEKRKRRKTPTHAWSFNDKVCSGRRHRQMTNSIHKDERNKSLKVKVEKRQKGSEEEMGKRY